MKRFLFLCLSVILVLSFSASVFASTALKGDVNSDGKVNNLDASRVLMYDAGVIDFDAAQLSVADVTNNQRVDNLDATLILKYDAGLVDSFENSSSEPSTDSGADSSEPESSDGSDFSSDSSADDTTSQDCAHLNTKVINLVDATVEKDGYSGDVYCQDCETVISDGVLLEKFDYITPPYSNLIYTKPNGSQLVIPSGVDVLQYTLKRANKSAISEYPEIEKKIVELVNEERAKEDLPPLVHQLNAYYYSNIRAKETAESFLHTRPDGTSCFSVLDDGDVFYNTVGENLYMCSGIIGDWYAYQSVDAWMNSPGHRANILNPDFKSISIAVFYDEVNYITYGVQLFFG